MAFRPFLFFFFFFISVLYLYTLYQSSLYHIIHCFLISLALTRSPWFWQFGK